MNTRCARCSCRPTARMAQCRGASALEDWREDAATRGHVVSRGIFAGEIPDDDIDGHTLADPGMPFIVCIACGAWACTTNYRSRCKLSGQCEGLTRAGLAALRRIQRGLHPVPHGMPRLARLEPPSPTQPSTDVARDEAEWLEDGAEVEDAVVYLEEEQPSNAPPDCP